MMEYAICGLCGTSEYTYEEIEWDIPICPDCIKNKRYWIPCAERLPEKSGYYLTYQEGYIDVKQWWGYWEMMYPITHWMDLPEPPKPEPPRDD